MSLHLEITETREGGWVRLMLSGELDYASERSLENRLRDLRAESVPVRLNLSEIEFMDSSGLAVLIRAVRKSRSSGWKLEIERDISPWVEARFKNLGLSDLLGW